LNIFDKCKLESNVLCDMEYNCINCAKQENRWAEIWIKGPAKIVEAEADEKPEVRVPAKSPSSR
jgi:hypothetical protein